MKKESKETLIKTCFELNNFIFSEHFKSLEYPHHTIYNICRFYCRFIIGLILNIIRNKFQFKRFSYYNKIYFKKNIFFSPTLNNKRAVEGIFTTTNNTFHITNIKNVNQYPIFHVYLYSCSLIIPIILEYLKMPKGIEKNIVGNTLSRYVLTLGHYIVTDKICKNSNISSLILSNDHTSFNRAFILSAKKNNIISLYTQHASVADYYPQLSCTYSVLDGIETMKKYASNGKNIKQSTILLLGASRYDSLVSQKNHTTENKNVIGLGINALDSYSYILSTCKKLITDFPNHKIIIRAHPNWKSKSIKLPNIIWSSAYEEPINSFFEKIDILISNDSCIHFDAVKYGLPTIMYTLNNDGFSDQYGFVSSGFVKYIPNYNSLVIYLKNNNYYKPSIDLVRTYDNSYQKSYEGKTAQIISSFINYHFDINFMKQKYKLEKIESEIGNYYQIP